MPITETVTLKAAGSGLMRTIGFPLKESFNVTDVTTLRLKDGATTLAATFTVGARWGGLPSNTALPLKWVHVTFKDTSSPRNLVIDDSGTTVPAQSNPLVVTNNTNDIVVSNGLLSATINKVTDAQDLITSFLTGGVERLAGGSKPRLTVPVDKKTKTTFPSGGGGFDYAAVPGDTTIKVLNASIYQAGDTVKFAWRSTVTNYLASYFGGSLIQFPTADSLPDLTQSLMDTVHRMRLIVDFGGASPTENNVRFLTSDGWNVTAPATPTPTVGMQLRLKEVEEEPTKTIASVNTVNNTITFTTPMVNYMPQGINVEPTVAASSTAALSLNAGGTTIEKQYGDKAVIIKQEGVLKDAGGRVELTLDFVLRHYIFADTGFVRTRITMRNKHNDPNLGDCPDVFLNGLKFAVPTSATATATSDAVTGETASVTRYKANNLHSSINHSGISNFQFGVHDFAPSYPNAISIDAAGVCTFDIFPEAQGPIKVNGSLIKSRDLFWGLNASNGFTLLDSLGATFDPAYIALSKAVRPNMVEKRDWNTFFSSEPQKFRDACNFFERQVACLYDVTQAEQSFTGRPAMSLYEYRWDFAERRPANYPFGWNKWGNTNEDVGWGNNRFDLPYILFREGLREPTLAKAELAFRIGFQQIRNRMELGQYWSNKYFNGIVGLDLKGLARYERASGSDPFNYTNQLAPTHSWNEGTCLYWALTDDPIAYEAALAGANQAAQYNYNGTANALLFGTGAPQMGSDGNGGAGAEPRYVAWPIHNLLTAYRYFGNATFLQRAQQYSQSFIATMALEPTDDGFINFRSGTNLAPLFQHTGYCLAGIIETWRDTPAGTLKTALGDYIVKVAKFIQRGTHQSATVTADAPMLTAGKAHPTNGTRYNSASHMPFNYARGYSDTLASAISASDTTIPLSNATEAAKFNLPNNYKIGVLIPAGQLNSPTNWEYFSYTGVSGANLTGVVRGFDGTTARAFSAGDIVFPTALNGIESDLLVATVIMGARISGDATLQQFAQTIWEDSCLYRYRIDGASPLHVTVGNYHPVNLWPLNVVPYQAKTEEWSLKRAAVGANS